MILGDASGWARTVSTCAAMIIFLRRRESWATLAGTYLATTFCETPLARIFDKTGLLLCSVKYTKKPPTTRIRPMMNMLSEMPGTKMPMPEMTVPNAAAANAST